MSSPQRTSLSHDAALHIRRLIFDGKLAPGERVPQDHIAEALGSSRIPVREALIGLEADGLVTIELYRGAFVNPIHAELVRDHYELYGLAYGFAARRAIERSDHVALGTMLDSLFAELEDEQEPSAFTARAVEFHQTVVAASQSRRIEALVGSLSRFVPGDFFTMVPDAMEVERRGLRPLTKAIAVGKSEQAARHYWTTMRAVGDEVILVLETRGLLVG